LELVVGFRDRVVLGIPWNAAGHLRVMRFEPGEWIASLA
jgi:hypothetical protein